MNNSPLYQKTGKASEGIENQNSNRKKEIVK